MGDAYDKWLYSSKLNKNDGSGFSMSTAAILVGLDAEKYIPLFRKVNINKHDMSCLTNEDLIILGVDSQETRRCILKAFSGISSENETNQNVSHALSVNERESILNDVSKHLQKIKLSVLANRICLKKDRKPIDQLLLPNCYATEIILKTLDRMDSDLFNIENMLHDCKLLNCKKKRWSKKKRKIVIGTVGSGIILMLAVCFVKSVQQLSLE